MAHRIQYRGRRKGWSMPAGAVYVGRHATGRFGRWGNPFDVAGALEYGWAVEEGDARELCVARHRHWLAGDPEIPDVIRLSGRGYDRRVVLAELHELAGHDLACWCPLPAPGRPDLCHAATLLVLASEGAR